MKVKLGLLFTLFICLTSFQTDKSDKPSSDPVVDAFVVPANKAYAEPNASGRAKISIPVGYPENKGVVSKWEDQEESVVWYLYQKQGRYDFFINNIVTEGKVLDFNLSITECYDLGFKEISKKATFTGTGADDALFCANVIIPQTGYYRYELKPISNPESAITIASLLFNSLEKDGQVNQTDYQSSPSVHLAFSSTAETTKSYDWIYQEILVPEGEDPLASYYMSLGFFRGYMGIQTNSTTERRVLFSVWDSKDADHDTTMTAADFVSLVDKGEKTTVNSFGNEGTGGQSYVKDASWRTGEPVKFLMNVRSMPNKTIILSAWYKLENEDWVYVATWRAPKETRMFDGFYSFIENYWFTNGQLRREAYYYNAWGCEDKTGQWVNFNKVRFSNTDGKEGQRVDYEQGVSAKFPDRFYMSSGGYTPTLKTANEMPLLTDVPKIDKATFNARVDQALKNEHIHKDVMVKKVKKK